MKDFNQFTDAITEWESKGLSNKKIKPRDVASNILSPKLRWMSNSKIKREFKGSFLKQDKLTVNPRNVVNFFIAMN